MDSAVLLAALLAAPVQLAATELDLPGSPPPRFLQFVQAPSLLMLQFEPPPCFCKRGFFVLLSNYANDFDSS